MPLYLALTKFKSGLIAVMISDRDYKRICWASRRGMLELDLMLVPFVEKRFLALSEQDQQRYIRLLEGEDTDLFMWCMGRQLPDDDDLAAIIKQIIEFSRGH